MRTERLSYWQRSGVNTERPPEDGLARISRRVHPLFVLCSPGGLHPSSFHIDSGLGTNGTSSGGRSVFLEPI